MVVTKRTPAPPADDAFEETDEERRRRQIERNQAWIALLDSWAEGDHQESEQEQREALEWLMRALDEDRPSYRKLFS